MFAEHLAKLARALDQRGIAYMLIGGQAQGFGGCFRSFGQAPFPGCEAGFRGVGPV